MQLPEKYKENFNVSSEGPLSGLIAPDDEPSLETSKLSLYFSGSCIPTNESLLFTFLYTLHRYMKGCGLSPPKK